jgi:hypothetical protein
LWRREKGQEFPVDIAQRRVVFQKGLVDFGEALQDRRIRRQIFPLLDERTNHVDAHRIRLIALQYVRDLRRTMLGECPGPIADVSSICAVDDLKRSQIATASIRHPIRPRVRSRFATLEIRTHLA